MKAAGIIKHVPFGTTPQFYHIKFRICIGWIIGLGKMTNDWVKIPMHTLEFLLTESWRESWIMTSAIKILRYNAIMPEHPTLPRRRRSCVWAAAAGLLGLAAICLGLATLSSRQQAPAASTGSLPITICAGVSAPPKHQVGIAWASPIISYSPPIMYSPYAACFHVPYLGTLLAARPVGQIALPP